MKVNQLRLKIANFRAIKEADILLNGITVVAGENGCGKSTLSQFLYYIFYLSNDYDEIISSDLDERLLKYHGILDSFKNVLYNKTGDKELLHLRIADLDEASWYKIIDDLYSYLKEYVLNNDEEAGNRLKYILLDILGEENGTEKNGRN
ncbi:MAG: AAA family ATPase [Tannerellaceae bacterium]|nr:AAA family ATPase [Tannerellaceae bacterium]